MSELEIALNQVINETREAFIRDGYSYQLALQQKKRYEETLQNQKNLKEQEICLAAKFYELLAQYPYAYSSNDYQNLIYLREELQAQLIAVKLPTQPSKWSVMNGNKKSVHPAADVISNLSRLPKKQAVNAQQKEVSYYLLKVNNWIENARKEERVVSRDNLEDLLSVFGRSFFFNQEAFVQALLVFFKASQSQLDTYQSGLKTRLALLTTDELKKINRQIHSPAMLSLSNAFYAAGCIGMESVNSNHWEESAFSDAGKVWKAYQRPMEWKALNTIVTTHEEPIDQSVLSDEALKNFGQAALSINQILAATRESVTYVLQTKLVEKTKRQTIEKKKTIYIYDSTEMMPAWPTQENQQPVTIAINDAERKSMGKLLHVYGSDTHSARTSSLNEAEKQDKAFAHILSTMSQLLFNPNRFIHLMTTLTPERIQWSVAEGTEKEIKKLYRSLQTKEVNHLILLLHRIKADEESFMTSFCEWLQIPLNIVSREKERLKTIACELCDSIDMLTQSVKVKLEKRSGEVLKDYPYQGSLKNNNASESTMQKLFTHKNSACMKQWFPQGIEEIHRHVKRNFWERCYDWIYPGNPALINQRQKLVDVTFTSSEDDEFSEGLNKRDSYLDFSQYYDSSRAGTPYLRE